ncbi:flagellar hook-basal body complex protein FliE [Marinobacterium arenosum]|uniref:flagellar hook-basal body complex protein FliE n=1 Tax=Marinobacterium arenosum TaxID=2862496 RepID=UPI001C940533|nr:flagellar hook-basal body complex protein FliE [Marinobacterium arenosum]MBY4675944.1 flagellar hook-basal body complex protein FliE [Marinobacterium arenosum]
MVDRADINSVLAQMRAIRAQMDPTSTIQPVRAEPDLRAERSSFGDLLKNAVDKVNETQTEAKKLSVAYEKGDPTVDLPEVMISMQKASVSFQAMVQVRNRLVTAYEDISKMPI